MRLWFTGFVTIALLVFAVITFNELIAARSAVRKGWSDIDVQLQRRHDLVPQLVAADFCQTEDRAPARVSG